MTGPAPAKINLALVVGPRRDDGKHELATVYQRVDLGDRITRRAAQPRRPSTGFAGGHDRPRGARVARRAARLARPDREAHAGRGRARRRQLRRRDRAAARQRAARRARSRRGAARARRAGRRRRAVLPAATARSSAPATARRSRRSTCRRTSPSCSLLPNGRQKRSTAEVYAAFDERGGEQGYDERLAALRAALAAVRRPRDLAALPPNDLASSPLAGELLAQGAFRADVSGAGPTVYGLFHRIADADARAPRAASVRPRLGDRACVVRLICMVGTTRNRAWFQPFRPLAPGAAAAHHALDRGRRRAALPLRRPALVGRRRARRDRGRLLVVRRPGEPSRLGAAGRLDLRRRRSCSCSACRSRSRS